MEKQAPIDFNDPHLYQPAEASELPLLLEMMDAIVRWEDGISGARELAICLLRVVQKSAQ